jgi:hypothetical protein
MYKYDKMNTEHEMSVDTLKNFTKQQKLPESSQEMKKELLQALHGYPNEYKDDKKELKKVMRTHGVKIKKLWVLKWLRGEIMGSKFVGLSFGPYIDVGNDDDMQTLVTHEAHHKLQYDENSFLPQWVPNDVRALLGFIVLSIKTLKEIKKLKKSRIDYGKWEAWRYAATHNSMEFEAFLHEGDIDHLYEREPYEYKKYTTKEGRQKKLQEYIDKDIEKVETIQQQVFDIIRSGHMTDEDQNQLQYITNYLVQETEKIKKIKEEYGQEEWDIVDVKHPIYGRSLWLESEKNRKKRLQILKQSLEKEDDLIWVIKRHQEIEVVSKTKEREVTGVIKVRIKNIYRKKGDKEIDAYQEILKQLESDPRIQEFTPHMRIDWSERDNNGNPITSKGLIIKISIVP